MATNTTNPGRRTPQRKIVEVRQINEYGHLQPQALELERAVLGALMIESDAYSRVGELLRPESFYEIRNQKIYSAIQTLSINDDPIDMLTVTEKLRTMGELEEVGGPLYISQLTGGVASSAHIEFHAKIIAQKALARQLITFSSEIQTDAFDETQDVNQLMQTAEQNLFAISQQNLRKEYKPVKVIVGEAYDQLKKAAANTSGITGLASGFEELDRYTSGWQKSDLIIIAARPAMGKTAFVLSMAKNIAVNNKQPVALFSLEMSDVQLANRLISNVCHLPGDKIKSGNLVQEEWAMLDYHLSELTEAPLYIDDTPSLSIFELRTKARRLKRQHDIQLLIIDYLQLMSGGLSYGNRQEEVSTISRSLKGLAKELDIPVIALSQLNRSVEMREGNEGKRPQLSDLRESGAIEQDADIVCFIHRPEYYHIYEDEKGNDLRGMAEIIIAKHRNGAMGDLRLKFEGPYTRFCNLSENSIRMPEPRAVPSRANRSRVAAPAYSKQEGLSPVPDLSDAPENIPLPDTPYPLGGVQEEIPF